MPGKYLQPTLIEQLKTLLASREGRAYLQDNAWSEGMPIIAGRFHESLETTMGLASLQRGPALIAVAEPGHEDLRLLHISEPHPFLQIVPAAPRQSSLWDLLEAADSSCFATFRVRQWKYSAVAHALPSFSPSFPEAARSCHRYSLPLG